MGWRSIHCSAPAARPPRDGSFVARCWLLRPREREECRLASFRGPPSLPCPRLRTMATADSSFRKDGQCQPVYPLSIVTGGTTAKIMVAAKDNFLGKYIYKDTLARNLAAVIYLDEKEIQKTAFKQHRTLQEATEFRYGYKLVENGNVRAAISTNDVIELPTGDQLKTVLDKVKDFFGDAKESFG